MCVFGNPVDKVEELEEGGPAPSPPIERSFGQNAALLSFCFVGLQVANLFTPEYNLVEITNAI